MHTQPDSRFLSASQAVPQSDRLQAKPAYWALIPCAGEGVRALTSPSGHGAQSASLRKQYQPIAGCAMVLHTLLAFAGVKRLQGTLVAVSAGDTFFDHHACACRFAVTCGGATRADTVRGGLRALQERGASDDDWVLVHDAARCLVTTAQINSLIDACEDHDIGGLLAQRVTDTLKVASSEQGGMCVAATLERSDKWLAQTPQMFRLGRLAHALEQFGPGATDESAAMEALGDRPLLVPGSALNFKVTYPEDFALAEAVLLQRRPADSQVRDNEARDNVRRDDADVGRTAAMRIATLKPGEQQ